LKHKTSLKDIVAIAQGEKEALEFEGDI